MFGHLVHHGKHDPAEARPVIGLSPGVWGKASVVWADRLYDQVVMRVRAPGSSANLGPGFDVLGLAVNRYVWAWDDGDDSHGEPCGPDHIARIAYEQAGGEAPIWFDFELEPSRGLGFSAAARAAGALLARLQHGSDLATAQEEAYQVVADIEGHGDNAAPSVFGGTYVIAGEVHHQIAASMPGNLLFWVPDFETLTDDSRACLDTSVPRADAVYNLGRIALLMAAMYEQRLDLMAEATLDRLHQPMRLEACEMSAKAYHGALAAGAAAVWLSGSGPTVAIVAADEAVPEIRAVLGESGQVLALEIDQQGAIPVDA